MSISLSIAGEGSRVLRAAFYVVTGVGIATDAVLRTIERHQIHLRRLEQNVDGRTKVPVHPAGIGHQSHPLAAEFLEAIHLQHVDAREHLRVYKLPGQYGQKQKEPFFTDSHLAVYQSFINNPRRKKERGFPVNYSVSKA